MRGDWVEMKVASQEKAWSTIDQNKGGLCVAPLSCTAWAVCSHFFFRCLSGQLLSLFLKVVGKDVRGRVGNYVWNEGEGEGKE